MSNNIALIGCGAIAQAFYLPALTKMRGRFDRVWVVDPNDRVLERLAATLDATKAASLAGVKDEVDFVIVAAPNALHYRLGLEALDRGANVLLEKPFVVNPTDGRYLIERSRQRNAVVAVNQTRRLFPMASDLRRRIEANEYGALQSVQHLEGVKLNWAFESGAAFARTAERSGVIMDFGVHVIDFYHFILQPQWAFVSGRHDGFNGPEGLAEIELRANDVPVYIRLSRYQPQANQARLVFSKAEVLFNVFDWSTYSVRWRDGRTTQVVAVAQGPGYVDLAVSLIDNFVLSAEGKARPLCDAASSLPVITVLDDTYRGARRYPSSVGAV